MFLRTKLTLLLFTILFLIMGASTLFVIQIQEKRALDATLKNSSLITAIVHHSVKDAMKKHDGTSVKEIISSIGENPKILSLRVLSRDGVILVSNNEDEVGSKSRGYVLQGYRMSDEEPIMHDRTVTSYRLIRNELGCVGCHSAKQDTNGVVELALDISQQQQEMASTKKVYFFANLLSVLIISALLSSLFSRKIIRPINALMRTAGAAGSGIQSARMAVKGDDEIGILGRAFNRMLGEIKNLSDLNHGKDRELSRIKSELDHARTLEELNSQLTYKVRQLETANKTVLTLTREIRGRNDELARTVEQLKRISDISLLVSGLVESEEILRVTLKTSADMLSARKGFLHIQRDDYSTVIFSFSREYGLEKQGSLPQRLQETCERILLGSRPVIIRSEQPAGTAETPSLNAESALGVPIRMKGRIIGALCLQDKTDGTAFSDSDLDLLSTLSSHAAIAAENAWLYEKLKTNFFATLQSLVNALEASEHNSKGHSERVRFLAVKLAHHIGLEPGEIEALEYAAILHDIGKIAVDSSLFAKTGSLTAEELRIIRSHPVISDEILGPVETIKGVKAAILQHHERYDGSGYPFGLSGEQITFKARILSVVDTFDAMVTPRPYRGALHVRNALEELLKGSGTFFDPSIVESFVSMVQDKDKDILAKAGYESDLSCIH
ncbi:MAG: HD domain-containing phosphohydrolase [bacterium]